MEMRKPRIFLWNEEKNDCVWWVLDGGIPFPFPAPAKTLVFATTMALIG